MVHVRFEGRSFDLMERDLRLRPGMVESQVIHQLAEYLEVAPRRLAYYIVAQAQDGSMVIRPEAVYH